MRLPVVGRSCLEIRLHRFALKPVVRETEKKLKPMYNKTFSKFIYILKICQTIFFLNKNIYIYLPFCRCILVRAGCLAAVSQCSAVHRGPPCCTAHCTVHCTLHCLVAPTLHHTQPVTNNYSLTSFLAKTDIEQFLNTLLVVQSATQYMIWFVCYTI